MRSTGSSSVPHMEIVTGIHYSSDDFKNRIYLKMYFIQDTDKYGVRTITLCHKDEVLTWNIGKLAKPNIDVSLIVRDINQYWATLDATLIAQLWSTMVSIHGTLNAGLDGKEMSKRTSQLIREFYELMPYADMEAWVLNHADIKIPDSQLNTSYSVDAPNNKLTYLKDEYMQLIVLATYIRPMMGVFGTYVQYIDGEVGTEFKELSAVELLDDTAVSDSLPYQRLLQYVTTIHAGREISMDALLKGLGSEKMAMWLMGFALVRRLPFSELPGRDSEVDAHNIVSHIYNYIAAKVNQDKKSFGNTIRDKHIRARTDQASGMDNTPSVAEVYKMSEDISEGDVIIADHGVRDLRTVVHRVDATVPESLIELCQEFYSTRPLKDLASDNLHLVKYVTNQQLSIALTPLLAENVSVLAIATTILLYHWGLYDLAGLATGHRKYIPSSVFVGISKEKLHADQLKELARIYPYNLAMKTGNGRKISTENEGVRTVEKLTSFYSTVGWQLRLPPKLQRQTNFQKNQYAYLVPATIKLQLADMLIKLNEIGSL